MSQRLEQLRKLATLAPDDPMSHYGVGLELIQLERWREAAEAFATALRVNPAYSAAYYHKARAEIAAGDETGARSTLDAGIAVAGDQGDWKTEGEMRELLNTI